MPNCTVGVMNGLFYLDEIFYSENSPYLYGIDTLSSINQSKPIRTMEHYVNIMLDSGFKAALYDEREVMQFLLYLPYDLPSRREGPGVEIRPADRLFYRYAGYGAEHRLRLCQGRSGR